MNIIIGSVFLAIAFFLYTSTLGYPHKTTIGIDPGTWPRFIAYLIGIFSLALLARGIASKEWPSGILFKDKRIGSAIVPGIIVLSIGIYVIVWSKWRSFFVPTFFLTTIIITLLKQDKRSVVDYILCGVIGLILTTVIYYVFYYVFRLPL